MQSIFNASFSADKLKILLVGEYSGVHTNLAKTLTAAGHTVTTVSDGDAYKQFPRDIDISYKPAKHRIGKILNLILIYLGIRGFFSILKQIHKIKPLTGYDVVQLINPVCLSGYGSIINIFFIRFLKKNNKKIFLCALGDDTYWVKACLNKKFPYSPMDGMKFSNLKSYLYSLKYVYGFLYPFLNNYAIKQSEAIIPGLYDYYAAYSHLNKCSEIVPIIIETSIDQARKFKCYPIHIFHGWQTGKELRKGNDLFDQAIKKLLKKYPDKISYDIVSGLSYQEYIEKYKDADLFIDQCFSQDCGVNALLGMSQGKVVLSGFTKELKKFYGDMNFIGINSEPDVNFIYNELEKIIKEPKLIEIYSGSAIEFIQKYHNPDSVLKKYLGIWGI